MANVYSVLEVASFPTNVAVPTAGCVLLLEFAGNTQNPTTLTCGGIPLIKKQFNSTVVFFSQWVLYNPPTGNPQIAGTGIAGTYVARIRIIQGVDSVTPYYGDALATGSGTVAQVGLTSTNGDLCLDAVNVTNGPAVTAGPGQTQDGTGMVWFWNVSFQERFAGSHKAGAPAVTMYWGWATSQQWVICGIVIKSAPLPTAGAAVEDQVQGAPETGRHDIGARLTGFMTSEDSGDIVLEDYFKDGIAPWSTAIAGGAANPSITTAAGTVWVAPNGVAFPAPTGLGWSKLFRRILLLSPGMIGLEFGLRFVAGMSDFQALLSWTSPVGSNLQIGVQVSDAQGKQVQILTGGIYRNVATIPSGTNPYWLQIKAVASWLGQAWVRLFIGGNYYPIAQYPLDAGTGEPNGVAQLAYTSLSTLGQAQGIDLGYSTLTRNEPSEPI